jgi:hypothetical protein
MNMEPKGMPPEEKREHVRDRKRRARLRREIPGLTTEQIAELAKGYKELWELRKAVALMRSTIREVAKRKE